MIDYRIDKFRKILHEIIEKRLSSKFYMIVLIIS